MTTLEEKRIPVKKTTAWQKCSLCLYGNNFDIEVKQDDEGTYYYAEKCPKCSHFEEFKRITVREAERYLPFQELQ